MYFCEEAFAFFDGVVDGADVEESLLGIFIDFSVENHLESADSLAQRHEYALETGKLLGHMEGLREESLGTTSTVNHQLVVVGELVDTKDGDDVLKLVVFLEELLHSLSGIVVILSHDIWVKNT